MSKCETCGNNHAQTFTVTMNGTPHTFDSFECAIHALAPTCAHCGCKIVGHGVDAQGEVFCCDHCAARASGEPPLKRSHGHPATSAR